MGDDGPGRLGAARDEQPDLVEHAVDVVRLVVGPDPHQVIGRAARQRSVLFVDPLVQLHVGAEELEHAAVVELAAVDAHEPLGPALHERPLALVEPEHPAGESRRQRCGQPVDDLDPALVDERGDEFVDQVGELVVLVADRARREPPVDDASLREVRRIVVGDHVLLTLGRDGPIGAATREDLGSTFDIEDVCVAGDDPHAVLVVAIHRLVRPHPRERIVRTGSEEIGIEEVVGRPLGLAAHGGPS